MYDVLLDNKKIGTTELEKADAPMGVVFGKLIFDNIVSGYEFFKNYCLNNGIKLIADDPDNRLVMTSDIPNLSIINQNGIEIKGQAINIEGMDCDSFDVTFLGISYPFFEEEFPHHIRAYNDQFKDSE
jgi:hypothetical protein